MVELQTEVAAKNEKLSSMAKLLAEQEKSVKQSLRRKDLQLERLKNDAAMANQRNVSLTREYHRAVLEKPKYVKVGFTHRERHALNMLVDGESIVYFPEGNSKSYLTLPVGRHSISFWADGSWTTPDYIQVTERTTGFTVH